MGSIIVSLHIATESHQKDSDLAVVPKVVVAGKEKVSETFHAEKPLHKKRQRDSEAGILTRSHFSSIQTYPYIFVKYSLISCFVILGTTRNVAVAGCVNVAFFAPTITIGIDGIHILN